MTKMTTEKKVNNEIYRQLGQSWWDDDVGVFSTLRYWVNPVRFGYFKRILSAQTLANKNPNTQNSGSKSTSAQRLASKNPQQVAAEEKQIAQTIDATAKKTKTLLDIGCGGGLLAEEFARLGFCVTGVDPAPETIETAKAHAIESSLEINYQTGIGENLPFASASFDYAVCCDVFEHVDNLSAVVSEIARVLKPGGCLFFDTINRTFFSKIAAIKIMQEWRSTAIGNMENGHVWEKFIKPEELVALFEQNSLTNQELRGIVPSRNPLLAYFDFRKRAKGKITFKELGELLNMQESKHLEVAYMGYAIKRSC